MKVGPVTKPVRETHQRQKTLTRTSCRQIATSLSFFQFTTNLQLFRSRILDAWSIKLTFSLIATIYLTATEIRTKNSLTQLLYYCFSNGTIFAKKCYFFQKNANSE